MRGFILCILAFLTLLPVAYGEDVFYEYGHVAVMTRQGQAHSFSVEIANTMPALRQGLMYRESLAEDSGMLFVFEDERLRSFWMRNTLIPLDMLFIDADGVIAHIHPHAVPHDETPIFSIFPSQAVLEINGGLSESLGIAIGDTVHHALFGNALAP